MVRLQDLLAPSEEELQYDPVARFRQRQQEQRRQPPATRLPSLSTLVQAQVPFEVNATYHQQHHTSTYQPGTSPTQAPSPPGRQEYVLYEYRQELHSDQSSSQASDAPAGSTESSLQLSQSTEQQPPPCSCGCDPVSLEDETNMLMSAAVGSDSQPEVSTSVSTDTSATVDKKSRYLREMDRLAILKRLDRGEKQSALAKEYHVSRSSICTLLKHRDEVLARVNHQNPFCKHPKKPKPARGTTIASTNKATEELVANTMARYTPLTPPASLNSSSDELQNRVYRVNSRATPVLLSTLGKPDLTAPEFRRCATQLMLQLVQEALVVVPMLINATTTAFSSPHLMPLCAITMEQNNQHALLDVFHSVEPRCPRGYVQFERSQWHSDVTIKMLNSPTTLNNNHSITVLLLDVAVTSPPTVARVLESLQRSSGNANVTIVAVFVTHAVVEMARTRFPAVRILASEVESGLTLPASPQQKQRGVMLMPRSMLFKQRLELWYHSQQEQAEECFTLAL
ncbi:putative uracil phosphoribosyltransferase [Globisporangium polare]